jgi:beta-N-acetylglucosaminidase
MAIGVHAARGRLAAVVLTTVLVGISSLPAAADTDPAGQVAQAKQQLKAARQNATQQDTALAAAQQDLANAQQKLAAIQQQVAAINAEITDDDAKAARLDTQAAADRQQLADMLRASYVRGMDSPLLYIASAADLTSALQRQGQLSHIADQSRQLMARITSARALVQKARDDAAARQADLVVVQQQAATTAVLVGVEEKKVQQADFAAWNTVSQAKQTLDAAVAAKQKYDAEVAAAAAAAAALAAQKAKGVIYPPVPGVQFTVDTDLTQPSGETADRLNQFLQGTALQGLGGAFMAAETNYHVSARYLLAHAIEESAFGTSRIAQDKHNLYGYGADDAHPYQDAYTFSSFAACIDFVARMVAQNYLSPSGQFYHGPTLRGMNVCYASDPSWADNIAEIGRSFP